jgi:hypothetical protein
LGGAFSYEEQYEPANGYFIVTLLPYEKDMLFAISRDVTEIRRSEKKFRDLAEMEFLFSKVLKVSTAQHLILFGNLFHRMYISTN